MFFALNAIRELVYEEDLFDGESIKLQLKEVRTRRRQSATPYFFVLCIILLRIILHNTYYASSAESTSGIMYYTY